MSQSVSKSVVIVGGGFGGYYTAHELTRHKIPVTVVDRHGYQTFQPMLYQAATGLIALDDLEFHFSHMKDVDSIASEVSEVDLGTRTVTLPNGVSLTADHLVLATGCQVNFFGVAGAAEHALPLYTGADAQAIKHRLQSMVTDTGDLRIVVVGAGATGVEITGALLDVITDVLPRTYPSFEGRKYELHIVDHGTAPLAAMKQAGQEFATKTLTDAGVTLHMGHDVTQVSDTGVTLDDGSTIEAQMVVWAGGLSAVGPTLSPAVQTGHGGRVIVDADLRVPGYDSVYCIGDGSIDPNDSLPQLGSVAKQQGLHTGKSIRRQLKGKAPEPFHYKDMGDMAMVRHDAAVVEIGKMHHPVTGPIAFAMWLGLHAYLLPGESHRVDALHDWAHEMRTGKSQFLSD